MDTSTARTIVTARFCKILERVAEGNQSRLAAELGLSQSLISQVAAGKNLPGHKLLAALAVRFNVNPGWILTGEGGIFLDADKAAAVPVASALLPGIPADYQHLLTGTAQFVPSAVWRPSVFAIDAGQAQWALSMQHANVVSGDRLLIETDPMTWTNDLARFDGRYFVVRVGGLLIAQTHIRYIGSTPRIRVRLQPPAQKGRESRVICLDPLPKDVEPVEKDITLDQIVGRVFQLIRDL